MLTKPIGAIRAPTCSLPIANVFIDFYIVLHLLGTEVYLIVVLMFIFTPTIEIEHIVTLLPIHVSSPVKWLFVSSARLSSSLSFY